MVPHMDVDGNGTLDWFFTQYVCGTGSPSINSSIPSSRREKERGRSPPSTRQSNVPEDWKDVIPLYVHSGNRVMRVGFVRVAEKVGTIHFELPMKPDKIALNHREDILADIKQ